MKKAVVILLGKHAGCRKNFSGEFQLYFVHHKKAMKIALCKSWNLSKFYKTSKLKRKRQQKKTIKQVEYECKYYLNLIKTFYCINKIVVNRNIASNALSINYS